MKWIIINKFIFIVKNKILHEQDKISFTCTIDKPQTCLLFLTKCNDICED